MLLAVCLVIAAVMLVLVVTPLLSTTEAKDAMVPVDVTEVGDLKRRRLVVYENIEDLEFEYKAGKIAHEDYESLRQSYTTEAAQLMVASEEAEHPAKAEDALIEREVAARRARRRTGPPTEDYRCDRCGFENPLPVKFCGECGAPVTARVRRTP